MMFSEEPEKKTRIQKPSGDKPTVREVALVLFSLVITTLCLVGAMGIAVTVLTTFPGIGIFPMTCVTVWASLSAMAARDWARAGLRSRLFPPPEKP